MLISGMLTFVPCGPGFPTEPVSPVIPGLPSNQKHILEIPLKEKAILDFYSEHKIVGRIFI